jgi:hypothetical protein
LNEIAVDTSCDAKPVSIRRTEASPPSGAAPRPPAANASNVNGRPLHGWTIADPAVFAREILPAIQSLPLSDLVRATGLTHGYLSKVRRGEKVPHPRHWPALLAASPRPH